MAHGVWRFTAGEHAETGAQRCGTHVRGDARGDHGEGVAELLDLSSPPVLLVSESGFLIGHKYGRTSMGIQ